MVDPSSLSQGNDQQIPIEWNWDMDSVGLSIPALDDVTEFTLRTRCQRCWGSVRGRTDADRKVTGMRCLVCGQTLEGDAAKQEEDRIAKESFANAVNSDWGVQAKYGDGPFARKVFPKVERLSESEIESRVSLSKSQYSNNSQGELTRYDFPAGSPGWLFLQAKILIEGLGGDIFGKDHSIVLFPTVDVDDDGGATVSLPIDSMSNNPKFDETFMLGGVGRNLVTSLMAAFSCELAMKSISITCRDRAKKDHDLLILFRDMPQESQDRARADYPDIEDVMKKGRRVFDKWRYFERDIGVKGLSAMIDVDRARALCKAARVILDEAEMAGLWGRISVTGKQNVRITGQGRDYRYDLDMTFTGGESPAR